LSAAAGSSKAITTDLLVLLLIAVSVVFVCFKIFTHGIMYAADDIWWHMLWLKDFIGELNEGICYPRWLAHSHYLYGSPVLVFYPPFCFFAGAAICKVFSLSIMQTSSAMFAVGAFASGAVFYLCGRDRWGRFPSAVGALMITTAPYLTVDIYVRGAMGELFALGWLPLIMINVDRVHLKRGKLFLALGFCLAALTHVPSLVMYSCAWVTRLGFCSVRTAGGISRLKSNFLYAILGLGCATFFLLPVLLERKLINIDALLAFDVWKANLFFSSDYRGFFILPALAIKSTAVAFIFAILTGSQRSAYTTPWFRWREPLYWLTLNLLTLCLMSKFSSIIWQHFAPFQFLQYPWRWMTINVFSTAVLSAMCWQAATQSSQHQYLKNTIRICMVVVVAQNIATDFFVTRYRSGLDRPESFMIENSSSLALGEFARYKMPEVLNQQEGYAGVAEYTPLAGIDALAGADGLDDFDDRARSHGSAVTRIVPRAQPAQPLFRLLSGSGRIDTTKLTGYERVFSIDARSPMNVLFRTYYYPGWHLYVDGVPRPLEQGANGEILITAQSGKHDYRLIYEDTVAFKVGIFLSLISLCAIVIMAIRGRSSSPGR
jgi:hypothetical protein